MKRMKLFIGWARVSSREQEQEGFSLDVQIDAFHEWARREGGIVAKIFRVSETATKSEARREFRAMIKYAKKNAAKYAGILFYKIDRAARNMKDFVDLEELESKYNLPFISITQPVQNTPTGRMVRRTLATIAAFTTEQQALDVLDGISRRVAEGWFPSKPPFGYQNRRINKRSVVETHPQNAGKFRRICDLRVNHGLTVPEIGKQMLKEGLFYSESKPKFSESKLNFMLHDRSYLGFIWFRGAWHPGKHEPLVDQVTWEKIRLSFDEQKYRSHDLVYASQLIRCGHCGHVVTGEEKFKETKNGLKSYVYYRCSKYRSAGHPRIRLTEADLDQQIVEALKPLEKVCAGTREVIEAMSRSILETSLHDGGIQVSETKRLLSLLDTQRKTLLRRNLSGAVPDEMYDYQMSEFNEQEAILSDSLARH